MVYYITMDLVSLDFRRVGGRVASIGESRIGKGF